MHKHVGKCTISNERNTHSNKVGSSNQEDKVKKPKNKKNPNQKNLSCLADGEGDTLENQEAKLQGKGLTGERGILCAEV